MIVETKQKDYMSFQVPNFEQRATQFAESMLTQLWEVLLDNFKSDVEVQKSVTESYTNFLAFAKEHAYYEALQLSYQNCGAEHNFDTPGRQLNEDYKELCSLV